MIYITIKGKLPEKAKKCNRKPYLIHMYLIMRWGMSKELGSVVGRRESPFFSKPYPVVKLHKDIIAILSPEPAIYYSGTEKMGLCKECGSKLIKFYRKLVCSNCGNEYSVKNVEFPIDKMARHTLRKVARHLANKERDHRRELIRLVLNGEKHE